MINLFINEHGKIDVYKTGNDDIIIGTDGCILIFNIKLNEYKLYSIINSLFLNEKSSS